MALRWGQGITYKIFTLKDQERFIVYESGIEIWLEDTLYTDFFPKWENVPAVRKIGYILYALVKVTRSCWKWRVQVEAFTALRETFYEDCKLLSAQNMWIVLNITGCLSSISCFLAIICGDWCNHTLLSIKHQTIGAKYCNLMNMFWQEHLVLKVVQNIGITLN